MGPQGRAVVSDLQPHLGQESTPPLCHTPLCKMCLAKTGKSLSQVTLTPPRGSLVSALVDDSCHQPALDIGDEASRAVWLWPYCPVDPWRYCLGVVIVACAAGESGFSECPAAEVGLFSRVLCCMLGFSQALPRSICL